MRLKNLWVSIPGLLLATGAYGAESKVDALKISCEEFVAMPKPAQERTASFLEGYSKRDVNESAVGEVEVAPDIAVAVTDCKAEPKATFWDKLKAHLPGVGSSAKPSRSSGRVKPVELTCEEFLALGDPKQPQVVFWLDGYSRKNTDAVVEVDLKRDVLALGEVCRPAPKETLWSKLKSIF